MNHFSRLFGTEKTIPGTAGRRSAAAIAMIAGFSIISVVIGPPANAQARSEQGGQSATAREFPTAERIGETLTGDITIGRLNQQQFDAIIRAHGRLLKKLEAGEISDEAAISKLKKKTKSIYEISVGGKSPKTMTEPVIDLA